MAEGLRREVSRCKNERADGDVEVPSLLLGSVLAWGTKGESCGDEDMQLSICVSLGTQDSGALDDCGASSYSWG